MTNPLKPAVEYEEEIRIANIIQAMDSIGRMGAAMAIGSLWGKFNKRPRPDRNEQSGERNDE